jgi:hypothetical protein
MTTCPDCGRRLLAQASVRCNWCGAEIVDPEFRARAENERDAYFAHQREHDASAIRKIESININVADQWNSALPYAPSVALNQRQRALRAAQRRGSTNFYARRPEEQAGTASTEAPPPADEPVAPAAPADRFGHLEF